MKRVWLQMGMPIKVEILDPGVSEKDLHLVKDYFKYVDEKFSTFKGSSEISKINRGEVKPSDYSQGMEEVFELAEKTKQETDGYFDIFRDGKIDPSGIVKGWAILNASKILKERGFKNFYVEAGGDIQVAGLNSQAKKWQVGIKNPFNQEEIVKVLYLTDGGIATSGNYIRGEHIYNPKDEVDNTIVSLTVVGPDVLEADRFATAAFAMGKVGIAFIEKTPGLEGYMIDRLGVATFTSNFERYLG